MTLSAASYKQKRLYAEFAFIYIFAPLIFMYFSDISPIIPLAVLGISSFFYLYKKKGMAPFVSFTVLKGETLRMLTVFLPVSLVLLAFTIYFYPTHLFYCIRQRFTVWCSIIALYPLLSVIPQEIIYRGLLFERYSQLFGSEKSALHLSALAFSFAHIIYLNPVALLLTLGGGYLFAWTYKRTGSILLVSFEHAMYGCMLFSIGLGRFFFYGFDKL